MATYLELATISTQAGYGDWVKKIITAIQYKAWYIAQLATPTVEQIAWAKYALEAYDKVRDSIEPYILAANHASTVTQILSMTDTAVQTAVDSAVDNLLSK